jgi:putative ABC transport system substrate-binding protein
MAGSATDVRYLTVRLQWPQDSRAHGEGDPVTDRRSFVCATALALAGVPSPARGQVTAKLPRMGFLTVGGPNFTELAFFDGLRELGYVDGRTIVVDRRSAEGDQSRLPALAAELVRARPDVIVTMVTAASIAASRATTTVPIVMVAVGDPVAAGIVGSLARPSGNVTGTSSLSTAAIGKQIDLIREILPRAARVAMLWNPGNAVFQQQLLGAALTAAARAQMFARILEASSVDDIDRAFAALGSQRPDAVLVFIDPLFTPNAARIVEHANALRLPLFGGSRQSAEAGFVATYGSDLAATARRSARYVQRILKGAKPGDLAIEQPTEFELFVNLRSAKALGLQPPEALLARAKEVFR